MKILALNGSSSKNGNTAFLLNSVLEYCKEAGADVECANVYEAVSDAKIPFCINCSTPCSKQCYSGTKLEELYKKVDEADFVIIGSPVYFGSMSAQLKAFFDKTRDVRGAKRWLGKPMAAVSVGASKYGGQEHTAEHIIACAQVLGMTVVGNSSNSLMGHFGVLAQRPAAEDEYAKTQCKVLAERIISELE